MSKDKPIGMVDDTPSSQVSEGSDRIGAVEDNRLGVTEETGEGAGEDSLKMFYDRNRAIKAKKEIIKESKEKALGAEKDIFAQHHGKAEIKYFAKELAKIHAESFKGFNPISAYKAKDKLKWRKEFEKQYPELSKKYIDIEKDINPLIKKWRTKDLMGSKLSSTQKKELRIKIKNLEVFKERRKAAKQAHRYSSKSVQAKKPLSLPKRRQTSGLGSLFNKKAT